MIEFRMPSLGADMEAGTLCEWRVKPGDAVKRGDVIALVDTQKGLIDIEVFDDGIVDQLIIKEDEKVPVGTLMALLRTNGETPSLKPALKKEEREPVAELKTEPVSLTPALEKREEKVAALSSPVTIKASPLAKRLAAEKGLDLSTIKGSGEEGAITKDDVEKAVVEKEATKVKPAASTESIRMAVAAAMSKSNREIPHYYLSAKMDMHQALTWLAEANKKRPVQKRLLPVVVFIKAVAKAVSDVPQLNGYWDNGLQQKTDVNIGFVISLRTGGIMIPAIHHADKKTLDEIMEWLNDIIPRARALNLRSSDLIDSTLTITSLGEGITDTVFGVIYPPQVALVGIGSIQEQPWAQSGMLAVRPVVTITLAADHRATDGLIGSRFLNAVNKYLQNPGTL